MANCTSATLTTTLERLSTDALSGGVSREAVSTARKATARVLGLPVSRPLTVTEQRRAEAYFTAVVRRRAVRRGQPARGAARFVVAAVVEDLKASGREGEAIWEQLQRGWSDSVPVDILEEFRLKLCG